MRHAHAVRFGALLALIVTIAAMVASTAVAGKVFRETIHVEVADEIDNFCGEEGMTVARSFVMDIGVHVVPHGDGLEYFLQHGIRTEVLTFEGTSLTSTAKVIEKDMRVTDNGDGTVTVLILATGNGVLYGEDGNTIARNPGQVRLELVFDESGAELSRRVVRESTGRSDDFCDAAVAALS